MNTVLTRCQAKPGFFSFLENNVDPDQLTSVNLMKPSDRDLHWSPLILKVHCLQLAPR